MSLDIFKEEVSHFLSREEPEVLSISGRWGVGKTYAWMTILREARERNGAISLGHYAYVSLFGLESLADIKRAIFQNTVSREKAGESADLTTFKSAVDGLRSFWRAGASVGRIFAPFADYAAAAEQVGFFSVRKQIVCFDDLERKSAAVDMRDVLGLISHLKEQRNCKVVILLNDEKLAGDDEEFRTQLEKVADTFLRFEPTPEEAAEIGISTDISFRSSLMECTTKLGIVNIRTIRKLERWCRRLEGELSEFDPRVFGQAVQTVALFGYAKLQPDIAPSFEFLRALNPLSVAAAELETGEVEHPDWLSLLSDYGFGHVDGMDAVIAEGIQSGHFDVRALKIEASKVADTLRARDADDSFNEAWELYHGSFDDNADEVMAKLAGAIERIPEAITPLNLSGTIRLLKELGWQGDVKGIISSYISARGGLGREFWDLSDSAFGDEVTDPDVRAAFAAKLSTLKEERDLAATLIELAKRDGWSGDIPAYLAAQPVEEYYAVFKRLRGYELRRAIKGALIFRSISNSTEQMKKATKLAEDALRKIAAETPINLRRVRQKGVDVPASIEAAQ